MDVLDRADLPFPHSLPEFQRLFPDDAACAALPYIRFAPILALVGVGVNRIGKQIIKGGTVIMGPRRGGFDRDPMAAYIATVMRVENILS